MNYNRINTTRILIIGSSIILTIYFSSCSILNKKDSEKVNKQEPLALSLEEYEKVENIELHDSTDVQNYVENIDVINDSIFYPDNSLSDSTWVSDQGELMKDMDNDTYIENINNSWLDKVSNSMFGNQYVEDEKIEVIRVSDSVLKQRLAYLNSQTPIDLEYNPIVKSFIETYVYNRSSQMSRMMGLAEYYYPMFEEVLDKYQMPLELKHLAIVESALNPRARSRVGASGLWQFMYATGKVYGLNVSSYVDERYDPIKATDAAARMMRDLYQMFGDWNLVLAAYNSGPGNVRKAIRRSGGQRNFWYIRPYLPKETRNYVPAFIAVNYAMNYSLDHNIKPVRPKVSYFETDTVLVKNTLTFEFIQNEIGIDKEELAFLNPSFKVEIIPHIKGVDYHLIMPIADIDKFVSIEDSLYVKADSINEANKTKMPKYYQANDRVAYKVRSGDNLGAISNKFGVKVSEIKKWNGLRSNNIYIGQRLTIYPRRFSQQVNSSEQSSSSSTKTKKSNTITPVEIKGDFKIYTVQNGDNLWLIAKKFPGVSADNIRAWNNIQDVKNLKAGMKLKIAIN